MNYKIYKLNFTSPLHLGNGKLSDHEYHLYADTLFSAMCIEARQSYGMDELDTLVEAVKNNQLRISDGMPYYSGEEDIYLIPKPMAQIQNDNIDYKLKKKYKNIKYIDITKVDDFLKGKMDLSIEEIQNNIGVASFRNLVSVYEGEEDSEPYKVGTFTFNQGYGLYIIIGYEDDEIRYLVEDILVSLEYNGIGGKRNIGLGRFNLKNADDTKQILESISLTLGHNQKDEKKLVSLSISLPNDDELKEVIDKAAYTLVKRSGFTDSSFSGENLIRKNDFYAMASGAVFEKGFEGILKNVVKDYVHPVYKYAKPIFMEV